MSRNYKLDWSHWLEFDPETNRYVSIKTLTKPQLLDRAMRRRLEGDAMHSLGLRLRLFAERLPDDSTPLGDVLADDELGLASGGGDGE